VSLDGITNQHNRKGIYDKGISLSETDKRFSFLIEQYDRFSLGKRILTFLSPAGFSPVVRDCILMLCRVEKQF
jgi:hypothetical protein